jgi:aryl-alcohol dehydrogenase-like predicted oxidoreductase
MESARSFGVAIIPWGPLAGGLLTGKCDRDGGGAGRCQWQGQLRSLGDAVDVGHHRPREEAGRREGLLTVAIRVGVVRRAARRDSRRTTSTRSTRSYRRA